MKTGPAGIFAHRAPPCQGSGQVVAYPHQAKTDYSSAAHWRISWTVTTHSGLLLCSQDEQIVDQRSVHRVVQSAFVVAPVRSSCQILRQPEVFFEENPEVVRRAAAEAVELARSEALDTVLTAGRAFAAAQDVPVVVGRFPPAQLAEIGNGM